MLFSETLLAETQEEHDWIEQTLKEIQDAIDGDDKKHPDWIKNLVEFGFLGFDYRWEGKELWIYAEESGVPEHVADFVCEFLKKFHKDRYWTMTWATTCSKPRVGEFDGGAVWVTADGVSWMNSSKWFERMKKRTKRTEL